MLLLNWNKLARKLGIKKATSWFTKLSVREKLALAVMVAAFSGFALFAAFDAFTQKLNDFERIAALRTQDYRNISSLLVRYNSLHARLEKLKTSFSESQMTFQQLTDVVDRIVKKALGEDEDYAGKYEFKQRRDPEPFGDNFEKQESSLSVKSVSLEQLVKLLHELQHGDSPLFMGKVEIKKSRRRNEETFNATLQVTSIGKRKTT